MPWYAWIVVGPLVAACAVTVLVCGLIVIRMLLEDIGVVKRD